ncbi:M12 family metallo-peptidase [Chryseobacterium defluvii]|uniref:Metallopeptidase family M12-like protein n=1 Tax=Chryseobacterium defluvii TaxID=160396 RepID=A0A495SN30_9FLAO|nr:M12 family metallo-peptidase [Chryseobacterium defluvii]RKT01691.1 metallopeptidase family M12-like protein [Chryseobacterium defluvii]
MFKKIYFAFLLLFLCIACERDSEFSNDSGDYNHTRSVGSSANDLLSNNKYNALILEIQYMPGYAPDANAIELVKNFLSTFLKKEGGISIVTREIPGASASSLSLNDIKAIENTSRSSFTNGSTMAVSVIYTNGQYSDNANTLGIAYRNTSVALLGKVIHDNSGGFGQVSRTKLEATVLEHELGHLLGLVDLGSQMQLNHKDPANGNHCNNNNCLMYYASETTDILSFLNTNNIPQLDTNCKADLKANGGK